MQLMQVQVAIANMPINLVILSNETLAFVRVAEFKALFDMAPTPEGVCAEFYQDTFVIDGEAYEYNSAYAYKTIPKMLEWLQAQNLTNPFLQG